MFGWFKRKIETAPEVAHGPIPGAAFRVGSKWPDEYYREGEKFGFPREMLDEMIWCSPMRDKDGRIVGFQCGT